MHLSGASFGGFGAAVTVFWLIGCSYPITGVELYRRGGGVGHPPSAAATITRTEPRGECLAIHARQLAVEQDLRIYDDIVALCCEAWNNLADQPWRIMSIGMRDCAPGSFIYMPQDDTQRARASGRPNQGRLRWGWREGIWLDCSANAWSLH